MTYPLSIRVTAPFSVGDVVARVSLEAGADQIIVLRDGVFAGDCSARPLRVQLTTDPVPPGEASLCPPDGEHAGHPDGALVDAHELFEHGVAVPPGGALVVKIGWGAPCHQEGPPKATVEGTRFGSWEHIITATQVGKDLAGARLRFGTRAAPFDAETALPVGDKRLQFGQIIALAGDFFAFYDDQARQEFAWAWPAMNGFLGWLGGDYRAATLLDEGVAATQEILDIVFRDRDVDRGAAGEFAKLAYDGTTGRYPARRYLALASQNFCHFGSQPFNGTFDDGSNDALQLYRGYHGRALALARTAMSAPDGDAVLLSALVIEAFGCHFLTDLFASGHIRVPRKALSAQHGVLRGALKMSHAMHAEDNARGLWCTLRSPEPCVSRTVWRAFGDGLLRTPAAAHHLGMVSEAVRRSAAEVFAASCGVTLAERERAEALLPVPLAAGAGPLMMDVLPDGQQAAGAPNHYPLYALLSGGYIAHRRGGPDENSYDVEGGPQAVQI